MPLAVLRAGLHFALACALAALPAAGAAAQDAATARPLLPPVALAGGTLEGTVVDAAGSPVPGAVVTLATAGRATAEARADAGGRYRLDVPDVERDVRVGVRGGAGAVALSVVRRLPASVAERPPAFVEAGTAVTVRGAYTSARLDPESRVTPAALPVARAVSADGAEALTTILVPAPAGEAVLSVEDGEGPERRFRVGVFRIASAFLERDRLRAGDEARFGYTFDFGAGGGREAWLTVTVTGPVAYEDSGEPRRLEVDEAGQAAFEGTIRAVRGTPEGVPFEILATVMRAEEPAPAEELPPQDGRVAMSDPADYVDEDGHPFNPTEEHCEWVDCGVFLEHAAFQRWRAAELRRAAARYRAMLQAIRPDADADAAQATTDTRLRAQLDVLRRQAAAWRELEASARARAADYARRHADAPGRGWDVEAERALADAALWASYAESLEQQAAALAVHVAQGPGAGMAAGEARRLTELIGLAERGAAEADATAERLRAAYYDCLHRRHEEGCPNYLDDPDAGPDFGDAP